MSVVQSKVDSGPANLCSCNVTPGALRPSASLSADSVSLPAGKNNPQNFVADFAVFDPATGKVTALAPLQEARGNAQVCIDLQ